MEVKNGSKQIRNEKEKQGLRFKKENVEKLSTHCRNHFKKVIKKKEKKQNLEKR